MRGLEAALLIRRQCRVSYLSGGRYGQSTSRFHFYSFDKLSLLVSCLTAATYYIVCQDAVWYSDIQSTEYKTDHEIDSDFSFYNDSIEMHQILFVSAQKLIVFFILQINQTTYFHQTLILAAVEIIAIKISLKDWSFLWLVEDVLN